MKYITMMNMIGKVLGNRYEILELIGTGGMSYVYKARCSKLNRFVAIKILKEEYKNDSDFVSKFMIESQAAASLSSVNIVAIHDVGEDNGLRYIVMEYVEGITLKEVIDKNRILDTMVAVNCALQILNALDCANKNDIVHRDIKPHNILVTSDGILKVADFGIAKALSSKETKKIDDNVIGSVHYISPEQAKGIMIDSRSDIYSLGVVMYEMLTGRLPFDNDNPVTVAVMHISSDPTPIRDINITVPLELAMIVEKAMARDINLRYQSAKEMSNDLIEFKKHEKQRSFTTNESVDEIAQRNIQDEGVKVYSQSQSHKNGDEDIYNTRVSGLKIKNDDFIKEASGDDSESSGKEPSNLKKDDKYISEEEKLKPAEKTKSEKTAVYLAVGLSAVIILLLAFIFTKIFFKDFSLSEFIKGKEFYLENYVGEDLEDVKIIMDENNVKYKVESYEKDESYPDNAILSQSPAGDMTIKLGGTTVKFVVNDTDGINDSTKDNKKAKNIKVPSVIGQEYKQAQKKIKALSLECEIREEESSDVSEGYIIRQKPDSGSMLAKGDKVVLIVSKNNSANKVKVDKYVGLIKEEAEKKAKDQGLKVKFEQQESSQEKAGSVVSQSIAVGSEVTKESTIVLFIGTYDDSKTETQEPPQESNESNASEPHTSIKNLEVTLPNTGSENVVEVSKDGSSVFKKSYPASEKRAEIAISGSGTSKIVIYVNGNVVYENSVVFN